MDARAAFSCRILAILTSAALLSSPPAQGESGPRPRLWGELAPGPYGVGFRALHAVDRTRTWRVTRPYEKGFSPDLAGRPVRVTVWYPAKPAQKTATMRYADYIHVPGPAAFADLDSILEKRDRAIAELSVGKGRLPDLLATVVPARVNAHPAEGRFPLVLYVGGLNADSTSNTVLAEYLASHGYVFAAIPLLGPTDQQPAQARTAPDLETTVRDLEFAWSLLRDDPGVDGSRLAVIGHSLGGVEAVLFAMRNADVSAVVGLDGTYGFAGAASVLTGFYDYAPQRMRAALLDLRRPDGDQGGAVDLSAVKSFRHSDRVFIALTGMHHSDFGSFAMIASRFDLGSSPGYVDHYGWTRETGERGYQNACAIVRDFLDQTLKGDPHASDRLAADVRRVPAATIEREAASPAPPTPSEIVGLLSTKGLDGTAEIVDRFRKEAPEETVVDENVFNSIGYGLVGEKRFGEAVAVLSLVTRIYPESSNAQDSLGDALLAASQPEAARAAYTRSAELAAADPKLQADRRRAIVQEEQKKADAARP